MAASSRMYAEMSFEDFVGHGFSGSSSDETHTLREVPKKRKKNSVDTKQPKPKKLKKIAQTTDDLSPPKTKESSKDKKKKAKLTKVDKSVDQLPIPKKCPSGKAHKKQLNELQQSDPEFYKFLQKEDKELLDFQESDVEGSDQEMDQSDLSDSSDSDEPERGEKHHKPPKKLEIESDDSEASDVESRCKSAQNLTKVTQHLVGEWETALQKQPSLKTLRPVIQAFKAAVHSGDDDANTSKYQVEDSIVFNAVVRLALTKVLPVLAKILKLPDKEQRGKKVLSPSSSPHWKKVSHDVKAYVGNVLTMLSNIKESAIVNVILRHIYQLVPYYLVFPKSVKVLLKTLIRIWSEGDESSRVLAFLSIVKMVRSRQDKILEPCLKQMYMAYIKNAKFTSPTTLPLINFMQRSLVEVYALDTEVAYQHAFVYIRQLAIHLRNAMTVKKKETVQAVHNWQFVHSLGLWTRLVSQLAGDEVIGALVYPLVQIILGTVKLTPSPRYYPLRFHCVRMLNTISGSTGVFIPVLPLLLEIFEMTDFNKKPKSVSFKPFNFAVILKLSKTQLQEKCFREGVIDQLFELFLEHFHVHAHSVGFPELTLPAVIRIKEFLKKCKVANFTKQMKQVLDRVKEGSNFIVERRRRATFDLRDGKAVDAWESRCREEGTPLTKYYATWRKARDRELTVGVASRDQIVGEDRLPEIIRQKPKTLASLPSTDKSRTAGSGIPTPKADAKTREEFSALFDQSDSDDDDATRFLMKEERPKKASVKASTEKEDSGSDYSELDDEEMELLAGSADDDEDSDEGEMDGVEMDDDDDDDDEEEEEEVEFKQDSDDDNDDSSKEGEADEAGLDQDGDEADIVEDFQFSDDGEES